MQSSSSKRLQTRSHKVGATCKGQYPMIGMRSPAQHSTARQSSIKLVGRSLLYQKLGRLTASVTFWRCTLLPACKQRCNELYAGREH